MPEPKKSGIVVPHKPDWKQRLGAFILWMCVRVVSLTIRYRFEDKAGLRELCARGPIICGFWHDGLFLAPAFHERYVRKLSGGNKLAGLISASKDGAFLSAVLEQFDMQPVRGSSSRRGAQALLELSTWSERGLNIGVTPDGPRGPRHVLQEGIISLAQITGLPIVAFSANFGWKIKLKSWDHFQIPIPFSRCEVLSDGPVYVPRECSDEEREKIRALVETKLNAICKD